MPRKPDPNDNKLCQRCRRDCKQPAKVLIVACPDFEEQAVQLTVPLKFPPGRPKKARP